MNKIKYLILITCVVGLFAGCTEAIVDLEPKDTLSPDIIYSTLDGIESSVYGIFYQARWSYMRESGCQYKCGTTDLEWPGTNLRDDGDYNPVYRFNMDSENIFLRDLWEAFYLGLHKCNLALESLGNIEVNPNDPGEVQRRNDVTGVLLFFRAYFHLNLVQRWDNIVLADHLFTDTQADILLASKEEVYNLITSDLKTAIGLLPEASEITTDRGHITKGVARMVLAKAYMDVENWAEAAARADSVINDQAYAFAPIEQVFDPHFDDNSEIILSWQFLRGENANYAQRLSNRFSCLYDRVYGVVRSFDQGGRPYARFLPSEYYWSLFEPTDLRLEAWHHLNYFYNDSLEIAALTAAQIAELGYTPQMGDPVDINNQVNQLGWDSLIVNPTTKKYWEDNVFGRAIGDAEGHRNVIQYRLAEAYLIAAEAYMHTDPATGLQRLDAIRTRAGVGSIPLTLENIIEEHARELGHEGNRYEFLKRLGILRERVQLYNPEAGNAMQDYHVRWPIPYGFQKLSGVPQNTGYEHTVD